MIKQKRVLALVMTLLLLLSQMNLTAFAQGTAETMDETDQMNSTSSNLGSNNIDGEIELGEWEFRAFGGNTSITGEPPRNPDPVIHEDGSVTLLATGGKIASSDEGISFFFKKVPANANFEIRATAKVLSFNSNNHISTPNQKSFGLMLRDQVGEHGDSSVQTSNYVAVGALDLEMKAFYKQGDEDRYRFDAFAGNNVPMAGEVYQLSIRKSGNTYFLTSNGESETVTLEQLFSNEIYVGFYVARDAEVTFSNFDIKVDTRVVTELNIDASAMKTEYLIGEGLDLTGLVVKAIYSDGTQQVLSDSDFIVTGFDSSQAGTSTITIHYGGVTATIDLIIQALTLTALEIKYYPAKLEYYIGDRFDPIGLVVIGEYNHGYRYEELTTDQYDIFIAEQLVDEPFIFTSPGIKKVRVTSKESADIFSIFEIFIKDAEITGLEIRKAPVKTQYFIGDELDLSGLVVYAAYDDGSEVRLLRDEYQVSELDTSTPGDKVITISHKGQKAELFVNVKERELTGIEVTSYPKTTFYIGEAFDSTGLEVSKVYDNGDQEIFPADHYVIDSQAFDSTQAGTYHIVIRPVVPDIAPVSYQVTVREKTDYEWDFIYFGQSTSPNRNHWEITDDGAILLAAYDNGGKITQVHDGIVFYYTEIDAAEDNFELSADIKVIEYAKTPHDGQESFGIMARDAIGTHGDASVFSSNIAAVGGYSGGTRENNGTQLFVRAGVLSADGEGSKGIQKIMLKNERPARNNTYPAQTYRLTLAKTNSGYQGKLFDGQQEYGAIIYEPDVLNVQDSKIYVGFYVARMATIEVRNIEFTVTAAKTDPPRIEPPQEPVTPQFEVLSLDKTSLTEYDLKVRSNVSGTVTVRQGLKMITQDHRIKAGEIVSIPAALAEQGNTNFSITFLPDDTQLMTSYDKIIQNFTVTHRSYRNGQDIYVSPTGTADGTGSKDDPLNIDTAIDFVKPGQKIVVLDGHYVRHSPIHIRRYNDGTPDARKYLVAAPGARPVFDFGRRSDGVLHEGHYWHVKGLDFTRSAGNTKGYHLGGSHNIIENARFYDNGDTGLQISRIDSTLDEMADWPSHNLILNSTSFDNRDPAENNADGFAAKLTVGEGNVFRGCIAHNNIDDGFDLYTKLGTGTIGAVVIEDSIAYNNGTLTDGTIGKGDKNGFKLGGEGIHVPHVIRNSIAFGNGKYGFTSNSNPGVIAENNIAFNNAEGNLDFTTYTHITPDFTLNGFISYQKDYTARDRYPAELEADHNFLFNGTISVNQSGVQLTDEHFASLEPILTYERDEEGNIIWGDFLKFIVPADIRFEPTVLNLNGHKQGAHAKGNSSAPYATVYIRLHEGYGYSLEDIQLDSIRLYGVAEPVTEARGYHKNPIDDYDSNGDMEYMVKFSRKDLASILEKGDQVPVTISGQINSRIHFQGTTFITVK
ncbi:bacterial Ig-like domain-containing protein [Caldalkalibacillus thermarum TA2.A1]|uniref:Bacterial Ig-like domain-containing protein n=1 Tax=Caldalkalibacillus thermarum (strain TA2.A1) TaxID=986075 RepID=A0A8X8LA79_CALTT|nr:bacterial Ig-like domain-containing protein [Caldalkalibacillus thermarum]QZT33783.1 bacterial Ig-like domain-containing protein [Caldalkalibacillus thermarum TA2.A1]